MKAQVQAAALQVLFDRGWRQTPSRSDVAKRDVDSAVGTKEALAYCLPSSTEDLVILSGVFWSEGRNALSTCSELIPADADAAAIGAAAERFVSRTQSMINDTYAVRLHLRHP